MDSSKESYFIVSNTENKESDIVFGNEGLEYFVLNIDEYLNLKDSIPRQKEKVLEYLSHIPR